MDDSYDYLLRMPIWSLTKEVFEKLKQDYTNKKVEIETLEKIEPKDMYKLYINLIPKGRHFLKYMKGKSAEKYESFIIELLQKEYNCSENQSIEYLDTCN